MAYEHKEKFEFVAMIRMPDFVTPDVFAWAVKAASTKKDGDFSKVKLITLEDGRCIQALHTGPYDEEPATVAKMQVFAKENGLAWDYSDTRRHHKIYLSDPRRAKPENMKTILHIPVK